MGGAEHFPEGQGEDENLWGYRPTLLRPSRLSGVSLWRKGVSMEFAVCFAPLVNFTGRGS